MLSLLVSNSLLSGLDIFLWLAREQALYLGESREVTRTIRARKRESEKRGKTGRALRSFAARFDRQKWRACSHASMYHQCLPSELGKVGGKMEGKMCFFMFSFDIFLSTSLSLPQYRMSQGQHT